MLIAVDPGVHQCAVAWFNHGRLWEAGFRTEAIIHLMGPNHPAAPTCICELPEQRGRSTNIRMSDIINLTWAGARVCANLPTETVRPSVWKGQVPKKIHHERMAAALCPSERIVLRNALQNIAPGLQHNIKDAVSLGLWKLGRLGRGGTQE